MSTYDHLIRRVFRVTVSVAAVLVAGTLGYVLIEGWSTQDGFYMTVITLATVGYGETQELSGPGAPVYLFAYFFVDCVLVMLDGLFDKSVC